MNSPIFSVKRSKRVNLPNFLPAKLSCYKVHKIIKYKPVQCFSMKKNTARLKLSLA